MADNHNQSTRRKRKTTLLPLHDMSEEECKEDGSKKSDFVKACRDGKLERVKELLDIADFQGIYNGLVAAFDTENRRDVAKLIIKKDGIESLFDEVSKKSLFLMLESKRPDIAHQLLEECYDFPEDGNKQWIRFDYRFLEDFHVPLPNEYKRLPESQTHSTDAKKRECSCTSTKRIIHTLEEMDPESDQLVHLVVKSFLSWKWSRYIAWFYFTNLAIYVFYLSFLTAFALHVPNPQLNICKPACTKNGSNGTIIPTSSTCGIPPSRHSFLILAISFTTAFAVIRLLLEFCQLLDLRSLFGCASPDGTGEGESPYWKYYCSWLSNCINWNYFSLLSNYVEIPMYILSLVFVTVVHRECLCPSRGQWQAGTVAVLLAWIAFLLFLNKWPALGIYIGMFWKIILRFLMVTIIFSLLLIAFSFAFYMAFYEPALPDTPFESPVVTFVTMISFAIGSPDISIFRLTNDNTKVHSIPYPVLSYFIWVLFGILISVLFLNFLVGLAVDDVKELREQGERRRMKLMMNLHKQVEAFRRCLIRVFGCLKFLKKRLHKSRFRTVDCNSFYVKSAIIWGDEIQSIITKARNQMRKKSS